MDEQLLLEIDADAALEEHITGAPGCRMRERAAGVRELVRAAKLVRRVPEACMPCLCGACMDEGLTTAIRLLRGEPCQG